MPIHETVDFYYDEVEEDSHLGLPNIRGALFPVAQHSMILKYEQDRSRSSRCPGRPVITHPHVP